MKNFLLSVCVVTLMSFSTVLWADQPLNFPIWSETFADLNPCTGEDHDVTLYHDEYLHVHRNNTVFIDKRDGETSSGYYLTGGNYMFVGNEASTQLKESINDTWVSADGSSFKVYYKIVFDVELGEARMENFRFVCLDE